MRIRIEAPSSPFPDDKLQAGVARLRAAGHEVDESAAIIRGRHAYLNGDDDERRRSLEQALRADVDVIWLARGGYGLTRILPGLIAHGPFKAPTVIGFSDATALFGHLRAQSGRVPCVHGPLATTIGYEPDETFQHCLAVLERRARGKVWSLTRLNKRPLTAEGWLFAANLCVLTHLVGTPSMPRLDGAVVVLEEIHERPYRIDRMLTQLLSSGALQGVRAVIVGHLTGCEEPMPQGGARVPAPEPLAVFEERLQAHANIPLLSGIAVGHQPPNFALPIGARVRVTESSLQLLEDLPPS